jgi:glucan biosynthesis protein C
MIYSGAAESIMSASSTLPEPEVDAGRRCSPRFFHLDALRAALMFWGILVHASTLDPGNHVFHFFAVVSGLVRMEAFFVISGFLGYMLLKRYGARATVKRRLLTIGLPFVAALVLLNPLTNYLIFTYHNGPITFADYLASKVPDRANGPMNWHLHFWFLIALFIYSLVSPVAEWLIDKSLEIFKFSIRHPGAAFFAMAVGLMFGCLASRIVFELIKDAIPVPSQYLIRSIGNFLPFYAFGMLLFASPRLREVFSRFHWVQVLVSCALLLLATHQFAPDGNSMEEEVVILCLQTYLATTLSSLLFFLAGKWVREESKTVRRFSDAAYSVYLFHFLSIYLFAHLLRGFVPGSMLLLGLVSVLTFAATLSLHRFVIHRVPLLALLFNGRPVRRSI